MKTWIISDTHFGHYNLYKFQQNGEWVRRFHEPHFADDHQKGDAVMVYWWREMIAPGDKVYHLGDVAVNKRGLKILNELPGRKTLISGNHDSWRHECLSPYFDKILGSKSLSGYLLTHMPIHKFSLDRTPNGCIHGHIHNKLVRDENGHPDPLYINACVEWSGGRPIDFNKILDKKYNPALGKHKRKNET